jgi:glycosyltransferase EpsH
MNTPAISVIVPVYNVAPYLSQCLDSVLAQTFENFELLLIDDGSTDASSAICDSYAARDDRVRVVHQPNGGLSAARNAGLRLALGEYITFLDGDDWFDTATLEVARQSALASGADVVLWPYVREYERVSLPKRLFDFDHRRFDLEETRHVLCRRMVGLVGEELGAPENADALVTACAKLYRRDLVVRSGAAFTDTAEVGTEDAFFNLQVLTHASGASYVNRFFYHYRRDNATSVTTRYKPELARQWTRLHELMAQHIVQHDLGPDFEQALRNRVSLSALGLGLNALQSGLAPQRVIMEIRSWLKTPEYVDAVSALELRWFPLPWRLFFTAAKHGRAEFVWVLLRTMNSLRARRNRAQSR